MSNQAKAPISIYSFYETERRANDLKEGEWVPCETDDSKNDYQGNPVTNACQVRKQFFDLPVENPFVKSAPTNQHFWLQDYTDNLIKVRQNNQCSGVPYSDCFFVESEIIIAMPPSCNSSSILRVTSRIVWLKSTMMKSIINGKT